jgi:hypothetical protein
VKELLRRAREGTGYRVAHDKPILPLKQERRWCVGPVCSLRLQALHAIQHFTFRCALALRQELLVCHGPTAQHEAYEVSSCHTPEMSLALYELVVSGLCFCGPCVDMP